jgi:hypothetical protein
VEICRKFDDFVGRIAGEISAVPRQVQSLFSCTLPADRSNPDIPFCRNNRKPVVPENLGCLELIKSHKGVPMQVCGATIGLMAAVVAAALAVADEPSGACGQSRVSRTGDAGVLAGSKFRDGTRSDWIAGTGGTASLSECVVCADRQPEAATRCTSWNSAGCG